MSETKGKLIELAAQIAAAYVGNNTVPQAELPRLIGEVYRALEAAVEGQQSAKGEADELRPAISVKKSVTAEYIVCLEDGKKFKSLKRHLRSHYNLSPEQYREKWNLAADYPMVAPNYAEARSNLAKRMGLGQRRRAG
ncbi:MAG: MucR family transcriptional regulator [Rhizobiales bacterium]|nr:MucR family transcriptional regulator [Hyphomicrobiales bacterium]